jgi:hypothetical protein
LAGGGYASTYATRADHVEKKKEDGKKDTKTRDKKQSDANQQEGKVKQRSKKLECFICGDEHYANNCPLKKKVKEQEQDSSDDGGDAFVNATWEANIFNTSSLTYQVNAVGLSGFNETEVLLDNQADISIMRPSMLR